MACFGRVGGWGGGDQAGAGGLFFELVGPENGQGDGMAGYRPGRAGKSLRDKGLLARIVNKKGQERTSAACRYLNFGGGNDEKAVIEECIDGIGGCGVVGWWGDGVVD